MGLRDGRWFGGGECDMEASEGGDRERIRCVGASGARLKEVEASAESVPRLDLLDEALSSILSELPMDVALVGCCCA